MSSSSSSSSTSGPLLESRQTSKHQLPVKPVITPTSPILSKLVVFGKSLLAGGIAGAVSRTVVSPLERLKILYQLQANVDGLLASLKFIHRTEGIMGFFKGNGTNIIRIIPYSAVQFATYESVKKLLIGTDRTLEESTYVKLTAGASAGIASVTCTYPLDLVRTRLSLPGETPGSISLTIKKVISQEGGWLALYRGLIPTIAGIAPYVALNFTVYETLKSWMFRRKQRLQGSIIINDLSVTDKLACGGVAGAVAQSCTFPLDVIRRRMQVSLLQNASSNISGKGVGGVKHGGMILLAMSIWRQEGWRAFYRGMFPNLLKVVPAISTSFVVYEASKKLLNKFF